MPHTIPESPRFASSAEESVWRLLNEQLLDTDLLVANQRVTDHDKDHEIDLVVAIEGATAVVAAPPDQPPGTDQPPDPARPSSPTPDGGTP